jgi:uncharacterized membrane protein YphA (DoxX/SURF4 family)
MKKQKKSTWLIVVRVALACVFIFSGLTKIVDPVASGIKMDEYFVSFGMEFMHPFSLLLGILMNIAEFTLGFMLLFRIRVQLTTLGYLLFMSFFFFLTAWLALAEHLEINYGYNFKVVKDCGCFGQAITMSNLETFLKNVAILIFTLIVFAKRNAISEIRLTIIGQWMFASLGGLIALLPQIYCLQNLPLRDFSVWKNCRKCNTPAELFIEKPAEKEVLFLYQNDEGVEKFLTMDQFENITNTYPNFYEEYNFVDRIDSIIVTAVPPLKSGFSMLDNQGRDWTSIYLDSSKEQVYILFMHDLDEVNEEGVKSKNLQKLVTECVENSIDFIGITNSSPDEIDAFIEKYSIVFPIYYNPIDPIKGPFFVRDAIRSNPGLIMLKNGKVAEKKAWRKF